MTFLKFHKETQFHAWFPSASIVNTICCRLKVMLHETISNDDFQRNTALQCWNNVATIRNNVATILQCCVALKKSFLRIVLNPLSTKSEQHIFFPNNIHTSPREKVMVNKMISKGKVLWSITKFSQLILYGNVRRTVWRTCIWILRLKGLTHSHSGYYDNVKFVMVTGLSGVQFGL